MRWIVFVVAAAVFSAFALSARADDGSRAEQSVPLAGQLDPRVEAELRLRADGDSSALAAGVVGLSIGAVLLASGIVLQTQADTSAKDCAMCIPAVAFMLGGGQLAAFGIIQLLSVGTSHAGRGHGHRVNALANALLHPSADAARADRIERLAVGWSMLLGGIGLVATSVTLLAVGRIPHVDEDTRMGLAAGAGFVGSWLTTLGAFELRAKWTQELAIAPASGGGALVSWSGAF